jgi:hypothetical protein
MKNSLLAIIVLLAGCYHRDIQADIAACTAFCKEAVIAIQWDDSGMSACECQRIDSCDP